MTGQPRFEAQANSIFAFLKLTFFKMPRYIQIVGWLVFLALFVFLVLYPLLGITYYQGKVTKLSLNPDDGTARTTQESGLRIYRGRVTRTNGAGEFTLPVRVPNIPLLRLDFDFGEEGLAETVSLPAQWPFVSMFLPNPFTKIYYVPGSRIETELGTVRQYFIDVKEAKAALVSSQPTESDGTLGTAGRRPPALLSFSNFLAPTLHAEPAPATYPRPTPTLRLSRLLLQDTAEFDDVEDVYFEVSINGNVIDLERLPNAKSPRADYVPLFKGIPLELTDTDIPLPSLEGIVTLRVFAYRFLLSDRELGSLEVVLDPQGIGTVQTLTAGVLEAEFSLLPPVAIGCSGEQYRRDPKQLAIVFWLDTPNEFINTVRSVAYQLGSGFQDAYVTEPAIHRRDHYEHVIRSYQPERVLAEITYTGGQRQTLSATCGREERRAESPLDHYFLARLAMVNGDWERGLELVSTNVAGLPSFAPGFTRKGRILEQLDRFADARQAYERAVELDDGDALALTAYAYFLVDTIPSASREDVQLAVRLAERAVAIDPYGALYDTLGWAYFHMRNYEMAIDTLERGLRDQKDRSTDVWPALQYHRGRTLLELGRPEEAQRAFEEVVTSDAAHPDAAQPAWVEDARVRLRLLR